MRLIIIYAVSTVAALALQTGVLHLLPLSSLIPDIILILAVNLGMRHHTALAAVMAFGMGYATDVFSGSLMGLNALTITLVFLFAYEVSRHLMVSGDGGGVVTVFLATLLKTVSVFTLTGSIARVTNADAAMIRMMLLQAGLTAFLGYFVFRLLNRGKRMLGLPDRADDD